MIALLLAINVASLGYVCRDKIREALTRTVYVCTLDDVEDRHASRATSDQSQDARNEVYWRDHIYHEILAACGLDALRCEAGALMLAQQSHYMRGVMLTTGLKPLVAQLKKSDDKTLTTYLTRNGG